MSKDLGNNEDEVATLAGEGEKILMTAFPTSDRGKVVVQDATTPNSGRSQTADRKVKPVDPRKAFLIDLFKG